MRYQQPDAADVLPRLSRSEEIAIWRAMALRQPPDDPVRRWAERQLARAGLLGEPAGTNDAAGRRPATPALAGSAPGTGSRLRSE